LKIKPSVELSRGDIMYLLHVAGNMIEMTKGKRDEAVYVRLLAHTLRGLCKKIIYRGKDHANYHAVVHYHNAVLVHSLN
jgi:hypothetical protein